VHEHDFWSIMCFRNNKSFCHSTQTTFRKAKIDLQDRENRAGQESRVKIAKSHHSDGENDFKTLNLFFVSTYSVRTSWNFSPQAHYIPLEAHIQMECRNGIQIISCYECLRVLSNDSLPSTNMLPFGCFNFFIHCKGRKCSYIRKLC
jgi:hypothetical protein